MEHINYAMRKGSTVNMKASYVKVADPENAVSFSLNFSVRPCTSIPDISTCDQK
jgi:hypothetical protein